MKIFQAQNPPEAHIVCELLKSEDILCEVRGEQLFGLQGELPIDQSTQPYVWLFEPRQQAQAEALIRDFMAPKTHRTVWRCPNCQELNEAQFAICWQCCTPAP
ncbi:DUF2007 domain-containing protein [Vibrio sp.]|uniref:putative signal transducing protein n=1 Tax=Vibrio sp. TaxID=678 RepID=UPI003D107A4B